MCSYLYQTFTKSSLKQHCTDVPLTSDTVFIDFIWHNISVISTKIIATILSFILLPNIPSVNDSLISLGKRYQNCGAQLDMVSKFNFIWEMSIVIWTQLHHQWFQQKVTEPWRHFSNQLVLEIISIPSMFTDQLLPQNKLHQMASLEDIQMLYMWRAEICQRQNLVKE